MEPCTWFPLPRGGSSQRTLGRVQNLPLQLSHLCAFGDVFAQILSLSFGWYVAAITKVLEYRSPVGISEITNFCSFYF